MYVLYIIIVNIQSLLEEAQIKSLVVYVASSVLSQYSTRGISHINIHHYVRTCVTVCHDTVVLLTVKGSSGIGISLLSVAGKVYARDLNDRAKLMTADKVMDEQGGLRVGSGCNDQIFAVRQVVEKTIE